MGRMFPILLAFCATMSALSAQKLIVVNGGLFGGGSPTNLGYYDVGSQQFTSLDTLGTSAAQDAFIEDNRYLYVAASDSIFKYDLVTGNRLVANAFGGWSAIKLALYQDYLLVGNWYSMSDGNLRIFNKNSFAFVDSIPEIVRGATDIVVVGDTAYIAQNINDFTTNFTDSLGYLSVVDLSTMTWLRNDTLAANGEDLGRLWWNGDEHLYALNSVSNTIATYHIPTRQHSLVPAGVDLQLSYYGNTIFAHNAAWYIPFNGGIGSYSIPNALPTTIVPDIVPLGNYEGFGWAMDTLLNQNIFISRVFYSNQANNSGIYYGLNGDSLGVFPVGASPEVLCIWYDHLLSAVDAENQSESALQLDVLPNPTSDFLRLASEHLPERVSLYISDLSGRNVLQQSHFQPKEDRLDVRHLATGVYVLTVEQASILFIKQ